MASRRIPAQVEAFHRGEGVCVCQHVCIWMEVLGAQSLLCTHERRTKMLSSGAGEHYFLISTIRGEIIIIMF